MNSHQPVNNISEKILDVIKQDNVKPKARWVFELRHYLLMFSGLIFLIIGGLSAAVIYHLLRTNDWDIYRYFTESLLSFILITLPYVWILLLIVIVFIVQYQVKKSQRGYRYPLIAILAAAVGGSVILGAAFYGLGFGEKINTVFSDNIPQYNQYVFKRGQIWCQPEKGFLGGVVVEIHGNEFLLLNDIKKQRWYVIGAQPETINPAIIFEGMRVKMLGRQVDSGTFEAVRISPFNATPPLPGPHEWRRPVERKPGQLRSSDQMELLPFNN